MRNPAYFLGQNKRRRYFEGWYFKCISRDRRHALALIPGMAADKSGSRHAFIQVINAVSGKTWYFQFPISEFEAAQDALDVRIGNCRFSQNGIQLNIQNDVGRLIGDLKFENTRLFPPGRLGTGIMGPFGLLPFMECYHAIISLHHELSGRIEIDGETLDFNGGTGYIEKDYGRSFPMSYLWLQASHFEDGQTSFVLSRAHIPFVGRSFMGFFAYLNIPGEKSARFATYNFSKLLDWQVDPVEGTCSGLLTGPSGHLRFSARMEGGGRLRAPIDGLMDREIIESITAQVSVEWRDKKSNLVFSGTSSEAGMEISLGS